MPASSCENCGTRLPKRSRFCPECGTRLGAGPEETAVEALPAEETGPVPVELTTATPRFFGVTPPGAVLALAAAFLGVGIALLATGHAIVGGALLAVALVLAGFFVGLARRLPDTPVSRLSTGAARAVRGHAGYAMETVAAHSSARVDLFRQRRELTELVAQRSESARILGESVYAGDDQGTETARARMAELDGLITAKEEEMEQTAAGAMERIQRAQLQVQPTQIETPTPPPEPFPEPSPPPQPVPVPEPTPEPSEPPGPAHVPEPGPVPSPPPQGE
ncbi:MAG TPA: zinc ribbon domain-containing protein [Gaiellaceae bacterium]